MQVKLIFTLLLSALYSVLPAQTSFNRTSFYAALMSENLKEIDAELSHLNASPGKEAFSGALRMKRSGLTTETKEKLRLFKMGHKDLEMAIRKDSTNSEYRFLRLLIQENAPKIVNYNTEIKKDASYLREHYKDLPGPAQEAVLNYSKRSKELKPGDFKNARHD